MATAKFPVYGYNAKGEIAVSDNAEQLGLNKAKGFTLASAPPGTGSVAMYNKDGDCATAKNAEERQSLLAQGYGYEYVPEKKPSPPPGLGVPAPNSLDSEAFRALIGEIGDLRARVEALETQLTEPKKKAPKE